MVKKTLLLVALMASLSAAVGSAKQTGYTVDIATEVLHSVDLANGTTTAIGDVGFGAVRGLSFDPTTGGLFGVSQSTDELITIDTQTGVGTAVGALGVDGIGGLAFDSAGDLFFFGEATESLYSVNRDTGLLTLIGVGAFQLPVWHFHRTTFCLDTETCQMTVCTSSTREPLVQVLLVTSSTHLLTAASTLMTPVHSGRFLKRATSERLTPLMQR